MIVYYVRRSDFHRPSSEINHLTTRMSTCRKMDALRNAADSAIVHPGYYYYVYSGNTQIAQFYVEEEN